MKKFIFSLIISTILLPSICTRTQPIGMVTSHCTAENQLCVVKNTNNSEKSNDALDISLVSLWQDLFGTHAELIQDTLSRYSVLAPAFIFHVMVSAPIIKHYETLLNDYPHFMQYLPAIMCAGGGASSQTSTEIIEDMDSDLIQDSDAWRVIEKESMKALFLGTILGSTFLLAPFTSLGLKEKLSISIPLAAIITFSGLLGSSMPFILNHLGINPAQAAGPILTTAIDNVSILILFLVGLRVLQMGKQKIN